MELRVSSPKQANLSPPDCVSDPEEKELSDEDDGDRNHKHRRREARSQSLERDSMEQAYTRPYRKRNKFFENGHPFRANESQASESWKNYNMTSLEKDLTAKFERKRPGLAPLSRAPLDLNQRMRVNQTYYGDPGTGRGRGRDSGLWNQRDSRFSSVDIASQMVQPALVAPSLFAGRGLPNVSNTQSASWSAYGLIPGLPNGGLDTLHSIGLQGTLRPPLSSSLNMGITRQRCRDFEERGFCLRGDICPMEHGVNRIVVEDVQSLSQFNLTVPLPSAPLLATPAGPGPLPSVRAPTTLMGSKGTHSKGNKPGMTDDGLGLNGAFSDSATADGADLYDPDQPLWNNNGLETSSTLTGLQPSNDESEPLLNEDSSDHHLVRFGDGVDNECPMRITGSTGGSHSTCPSVWGRIGVKNRSNVKEKTDATLSSSDYIESETKEGKDALSSLHGAFRRGKRSIDENTDSKTVDASAKTQIDAIHNVRKPSQKALRTVFVNGIPQKDNRRESLFSHFRKFGEVVDIYIPLNSERAFIQFSKREEAEAALKAPDAVMGNRFIKLWWANRDSIPDDGIGSGISTSVTPRGVTPASVPAHLSVANKVKDNNFQSAPVMGSTAPASDVSLPASDQPLPVIANSPKVPPPLQKKLDGLEQLKEELRKKQELLDQKRNDFRRKLDKLEKQSGGVKCELGMEQAAKRPKVGVAADLAKGLGRSSDPGGVASPHAEMMAEKNKIVDTVVSHSPKSSTAMVLHESASFKQHIRPLAPVGPPFFMNRYKLDNRPTTFRIVPPLPAGLADVAVLKEHFSSYGDLSAVELEDGKFQDGANGLDTEKNFSALIAFTTRRSAERAFQNGKCWQGHNLQLMWLMSNSFGHDLSNRENSSPALKGSSDADAQKKEKSACNTSQEGTADTENLSSAHKGSSDADAEEDDNLECIVSQEGATAGNVESENSERSSVEHAELHGVFQPGPTTMSGEEESPKDNVC